MNITNIVHQISSSVDSLIDQLLSGSSSSSNSRPTLSQLIHETSQTDHPWAPESNIPHIHVGRTSPTHRPPLQLVARPLSTPRPGSTGHHHHSDKLNSTSQVRSSRSRVYNPPICEFPWTHSRPDEGFVLRTGSVIVYLKPNGFSKSRWFDIASFGYSDFILTTDLRFLVNFQ